MSRDTPCEMCAIDLPTLQFNSPVAQISAITDLTMLNVNEPQRIPNPCKINVPFDITEPDGLGALQLSLVALGDADPLERRPSHFYLFYCSHAVPESWPCS